MHIVASRLLPFRANRLANIIAAAICRPLNGFLASFRLCSVPGRPLFRSTCSSRRSKLYAPRSSSGRRGLGQGVKPQLVRAVRSQPEAGIAACSVRLLKNVLERSLSLELIVPQDGPFGSNCCSGDYAHRPCRSRSEDSGRSSVTGASPMKQNVMLTIASLLSILLMTFHLAHRTWDGAGNAFQPHCSAHPGRLAVRNAGAGAKGDRGT